MNKYLKATIVVVAFVVIVAGFFAFHEQMLEAQEKKRPVAVTIISIEEVQIIIPSFVGSDEVGTFPYIVAETSDGEKIVGVIDVITFEEGEEIIIQEHKYYESPSYLGYRWYRFVDYQ